MRAAALLVLCAACAGDPFTAPSAPDADAEPPITPEAGPSDPETTPPPEAALADATENENAPRPDVGGEDGGALDGGEDGGEAGAPACPAAEAHPATSPFCQAWVRTTDWQSEQGCCRGIIHVCGRLIFAPLRCVAMPGMQ
jgi:hypothetical protein